MNIEEKAKKYASLVLWKLRNPEKVKAISKRYRIKNAEKIKEANKKWGKKHPGRKAYTDAYKIKNKELLKVRKQLANVKYRKAHKEKLSKYAKEWCKKNRKKVSSYNRKWKNANLEKWKEYQKQYLETHREEYRIWNREYVKKNPEKFKIKSAIYHAKRRKDLKFNPLNKPFPGSHGHHINNNDVIFIPADIHRKCTCRNREKHRDKVLGYYGSIENMLNNTPINQ